VVFVQLLEMFWVLLRLQLQYILLPSNTAEKYKSF